MSSDQVLAVPPVPTPPTPPPACPTSRGVERAVVVPLAAARRLAARDRAGSSPLRPVGAAAVARLADYQGEHRPAPPARRERAATDAAPPARRARPPKLPASVQIHLGELESLLRDHIDTQLELLHETAPQGRQTLDTVRRSIDLLLRLRDR